eukprot:567484-Prorocentrum_minimum.AAC.2
MLDKWLRSAKCVMGDRRERWPDPDWKPGHLTGEGQPRQGLHECSSGRTELSASMKPVRCLRPVGPSGASSALTTREAACRQNTTLAGASDVGAAQLPLHKV